MNQFYNNVIIMFCLCCKSYT